MGAIAAPIPPNSFNTESIDRSGSGNGARLVSGNGGTWSNLLEESKGDTERGDLGEIIWRGLIFSLWRSRGVLGDIISGVRTLHPPESKAALPTRRQPRELERLTPGLLRTATALPSTTSGVEDDTAGASLEQVDAHALGTDPSHGSNCDIDVPGPFGLLLGAVVYVLDTVK